MSLLRPRSLLVTAFCHRTLANWIPALDLAVECGWDVKVARFPRICDPDHAGLLKVPYQVAVHAPIKRDFTFETADQDAPLLELAEAAAASDAVLLTTCHVGPETRVRGFLRRTMGRKRPLVVGLQHGYQQSWDFYASNFCFDALGVFGEKFVRSSDGRKDRMFVVGLPKLDALGRTSDNVSGRPFFLFAAQDKFAADEVADMLARLQQATGKEAVIRPHPEHPQACSALSGRFRFSDTAAMSVAADLARSAFVVTTGSTIALECLVSGVPVAVIPETNGTDYAEAGIVTRSNSGDDVLAVLEEYGRPSFRRGIEDFVRRSTGSHEAVRASLCLRSIDLLLERKRSLRRPLQGESPEWLDLLPDRMSKWLARRVSGTDAGSSPSI